MQKKSSQDQGKVKRIDSSIYFQNHHLRGFLDIPDKPEGLIIFAHGSGSGRLSPRNNFVAQELQRARFATLLFDLLEESEADDRKLVFDISLLAARLKGTFEWAKMQLDVESLPIGFFGASTGAAAAIEAAAQIGFGVKAVVSRGGRPDLAPRYLEMIEVPTLLIVGDRDYDVIELNKSALDKIHAIKELVLVPGATHLFEEPGTLEEVTKLAVEWFERFVSVPREPRMTREKMDFQKGYDVGPIDILSSK